MVNAKKKKKKPKHKYSDEATRELIFITELIRYFPQMVSFKEKKTEKSFIESENKMILISFVLFTPKNNCLFMEMKFVFLLSFFVDLTKTNDKI